MERQRPEKWANLVERRDFRLVFLAVPWGPIPSVKYGEEEDSPVFSWYGKIQGRNTDRVLAGEVREGFQEVLAEEERLVGGHWGTF